MNSWNKSWPSAKEAFEAVTSCQRSKRGIRSRTRLCTGEIDGMTEQESWEMKLAWQEAWQVRGCPPDEVLRAEEKSRALELHLASCPFCSEHLEEEPSGTDPRPSLPIGGEGADASEKKPGQVWSIRRDLGGWGPKGRYYNPPLVLILMLSSEPKEAVLAAQIYHDSRFAGPGDVDLGRGMFAQAWNCYTLSTDDLDVLWQTVEPAVLDEVHRVRDGAPVSLPPNLPPWVEAFRRLEIEVSAFFAMGAAGRILDREEASPSNRIQAAFPEPASLLEHLRRRHPSLVLPVEPLDHLETLAMAELPDDALPLAAAGDENRTVINRAEWTGEAVRLQAMSAELTVWKVARDGLTVGGRLEGGLGPECELFAWWVPIGQLPIPATEVDFSPLEGYFRVYFEPLLHIDYQKGRLALVVCDAPSAAPVRKTGQ